MELYYLIKIKKIFGFLLILIERINKFFLDKFDLNNRELTFLSNEYILSKNKII